VWPAGAWGIEILETERRALRITRLAAGGDGLGRLDDGRVVFVEGAVPGDLVELADFRPGKRMARARIGRLLEASRDRTSPACRHFETCGGCAWQHIRYAAQLEAKRGIVRDALERIGALSLEGEIEIVASPNPYAYRARARLVETPAGVGYRKRGSRDCVLIDECPILLPSAQARLADLIDAKRGHREAEEPRSPRRRRDLEWEILAGSGVEVLAHSVGARSQAGAKVSIDVLGVSLEASAGSFVQGNALLWDALAEEVRSQCLAEDLHRMPSSSDSVGERRFVELFAGIGFLTLPLARAGCRGVVFESGREALADLRRNLASAGHASEIEVIGGRIERRGDWSERFSVCDFLLLDPPRIGLDEKLRAAIALAGPPRVVYVSCDPATLARDVRELMAAGYRLEHVRALDLFPQTPHVEVVIRLERERGAARTLIEHT
jgi:23S rRNA (uracil1939-C5)-methyltransferase